MTSIRINITCDVVLDVAEVWPDKDHPPVIDAAAVKAVIDKCGGMRGILRDWELEQCLVGDVTVDTPNPHWTQDEVLIPDLAPPRRLHTRKSL